MWGGVGWVWGSSSDVYNDLEEVCCWFVVDECDEDEGFVVGLVVVVVDVAWVPGMTEG